ncbi:MAG TPA: hypothetical protein VIY48_08045 [Candidatus Paceibacterota bacterium]
MQNFSPESIHARLTALEEAITRHVPAGVGGELATDVKLLDERVQRLEHEVFGAAGVGAAQETGAVVDAKEIAATDVGTYSDPVKPAEQTTVVADTDQTRQ